MSFQAQMHPKVSNAEIAIFKALSTHPAIEGMITQQPIILRATIPDYCWPNKKKAVYLDGIQVHRKNRVEQRDNEIDNMLEVQGWQVLRIPYNAPLTEQHKQKIVQQIRDFIEGGA